jgi:hypothetical protein
MMNDESKELLSDSLFILIPLKVRSSTQAKPLN